MTKNSSGRPSLSPRQMQILRMLDDGKGRKTIAEELGVSVETVRTRIDQIKTALDVPLGADIDATLRIAREKGVLTGPMRRDESQMHGRGSRSRRRPRNS